MKITIGNEVFEGKPKDLANQVLNCKADVGDTSIAIIGEDEDGARIFSAAIKGERLPYALNELWDLLTKEAECEDCELNGICPLKILETILN